MSGASLLKISVPAIARDQHTSHVTTQPRRRCPCPTGMCSARLPQVALDQLPRPIDRPLERPRGQEPWPDLPHEVIEDRPPARIAQLRRELPQPLRRDPRIRRSCSQIHSLNGSTFDPPAAREYRGGSAAASARRTVLRCNPVRRLISRIDNAAQPGASA